MSFSADAPRERLSLPREVRTFDGVHSSELAIRLGLPRVHLFDRVGSTLDAAHALAPDSPSGTLVLADEQTAGRGQRGRRWMSAAGTGVWLTLIERPADGRSLEVLSLRCGLYAAEALATLANLPIAVKWPNDLYVASKKLAGILIETRWRGTSPDWIALGFGLNVRCPDLGAATGLRDDVSRIEALEKLVPALRRAARASRHLTDDEMRRWRSRDMALGRRITAPLAGDVLGISNDGRLLVASSTGFVTQHRAGPLTFAEGAD